MNEQLKLIAELLTKLSAKDAAAVVTGAAHALDVAQQRLAAAVQREQKLKADLAAAEARATAAEQGAARERAECERLHAHPEVRAKKAEALRLEAIRLAKQADELDPQPTAE